MTIMTVDGRRCDSTCQLATSKECHCVCGGRFHGAGHRPGGVKAVLGQQQLSWTEAPGRGDEMEAQ